MDTKGNNIVGLILTIVVTLSMVLPAGAFVIGQENTIIVGETAQTEHSSIISFDSYSFDTRAGEPVLPGNLKIESYPPGTEGFYIVQFRGPVVQEWKDTVSDMGAEIHQYIPSFAFLMEMDEETRTNIEDLDFVQWTGIYQPAYKISPALIDVTGEVEVNIFIFKGYNGADLIDLVTDIGGDVIEFYETQLNGVIHALIPSSGLDIIANIYGVESIFPESPNFICNEDATWILETNVLNSRPVMSNGVTGTGELITVMDSELRTTHEMFYDSDDPIGPTHRKIEDQYPLGEGTLTGGIFHGTHVCGTVLGDAPSYGTYNGYDGQAIGARLIFQDVDKDSLNFVYPPADLADGFNPSYTAGSRVQSNSWGGGFGYTDDAIEIDTFTWDNKDYNIVFAMGNDGPGAGSLSEQPEAKNCISVGGTQNDPSQNSMYSSSSRGYASDGRIKPTILGVSETTTSSSNSGDTAYTNMQGTSMAAPDIAGQLGQIRQYFMDGYYPSGSASAPDGMNPSAAMCKAILINGAVEITGTGVYANDLRYPNGDQGWGRSKINDAMYFSGDSRDLNAADYSKGMITGQYREIFFQVDDGTIPLEITLVWTDYPGTSLANPALVNDLDITVTDANGDTFIGNAFTSYNPGYSEQNPSTNPWAGSRTGGYDGKNVEENVLLLPSYNGVPTGLYTVRIDGYNVPQATQPYALVVTGGLGNGGPTIQLHEPNGGENLAGGQSFDITWNLEDREDNDANMLVNIYLSTDSGSSYPTTIATGVANTGVYPWTVDFINSDLCRIKITSQDVGGITCEDWSYSDFSITTTEIPPTVIVDYPTDADIIEVDGTVDILWDITDDMPFPNGGNVVNISYSDDNGASWIPIENLQGVGSDPYPWNVGALPDGVNYLIKITAYDSVGLEGTNKSPPFSIDNTLDDQWFFQVEVSGSNKDLDMKPVETSLNRIDSSSLSTPGQYQLGKWETTKTFTGESIDGSWTFNVYGYVIEPGSLVAYLYAKVTDGTGAVIDQTDPLMDNVGSHTGRFLFSWSEGLIGPIPDGQSVIVELWLDVVTGSGGGGGTLTYVPNDAEFTATYWEVNGDPLSAIPWVTEYPITESDVSDSENTRFETIDPGAFDEIFTWCEVAIPPDPSYITQIDMTFEGQGNDATDFDLWLLSTSGWAATGDTITLPAGTDGTLTGSIMSDFADYIIGGVLTWGVYQTDSSELIRIDFLETEVSYVTGRFTMEYDFGETQSNVLPTIAAGGVNTYDIPITVGPAGGWQLVSFPIDASADVLTIFDDATWGSDGPGQDVKWDIIYWYDPTDAADHWKSHNKNWGGTQDMPDPVTNHMGFWIHITDNPGAGDGKLTVGTGPDPTGETVTLEIGWNLVGYPSLVPQNAEDTLPFWGTFTTKIGYYDDLAPYNVVETTDGTTLMEPGHGYWVYSTIQQVWNL